MCNISNTFDKRGILMVGVITRRLVVSVIKLIDILNSIILLTTAETECGTFLNTKPLQSRSWYMQLKNRYEFHIKYSLLELNSKKSQSIFLQLCVLALEYVVVCDPPRSPQHLQTECHEHWSDNEDICESIHEVDIVAPHVVLARRKEAFSSNQTVNWYRIT